MSSHNPGTLNMRARTRQVVDHHYDDEKPGKPLYLLIPGGLVALVSLVLIIYLAYLTFLQGSLSQNEGLTLMAVLAPFYIGGVFLFSYGYELYNVPKALRLTAIIVFITLAAVVIVAVLLLTFGAMGNNRESRSSRSSRSESASSSSGGGGMGWGLWPIFFGGFGPFGSPTRTVTREVIREVPATPAQPPQPQPVQCPYCDTSYIPAENNFTCPNCGAAAPEENLRNAGST